MDVRIGIIDTGGFQGYQNLLGAELPAAVNTTCQPAGQPLDDPNNPNDRHGTDVAEVVYDVTPGAVFYLANAADQAQVRTAMRCMAQNSVSIINHSVEWAYQGPGDGTGEANDIVEEAVSSPNNILWVNAAGNNGDNHWGGPWNDPEANRVHNFAPFDEFQNISLQANQKLFVYVRWTDSWTGACSDYDLFLYPRPDHTAPAVARSTTFQACQPGQVPYESFTYTAPVTATYYLEIFRYNASGTHTFDLISDPRPEYRVAAGSLQHPADCCADFTARGRMVSVGAVPWFNPGQWSTISAQGPTTDGRIKPDLAAPTDVSTSGGGMSGTSAAAPHVAGAAALVKYLNPSYLPNQVKTYLQDRAARLGVTIPNNQTGWGRLALPAAPAPTVASISPNYGWPGGGILVSLAGSNFGGGASATVGGAAATSVIVAGSTSLSALTPANGSIAIQ